MLEILNIFEQFFERLLFRLYLSIIHHHLSSTIQHQNIEMNTKQDIRIFRLQLNSFISLLLQSNSFYLSELMSFLFIYKIKRNNIIAYMKENHRQKEIYSIQKKSMKDQLQDAVYIDLILYWVNQVRTNPQDFARVLEKQLNKFVDQNHLSKNGSNFRIPQGQLSYRETIDKLKKAKPIQPLILNNCLTLVAKNHVKSMIAHDFFQHKGIDGSNHSLRIQRRCRKKVKMSSQWLGQINYHEGPDFGLASVINQIVKQRGSEEGMLLNEELKYIGIYMEQDLKNSEYKNALIFTSEYLDDKLSLVCDKTFETEQKDPDSL